MSIHHLNQRRTVEGLHAWAEQAGPVISAIADATRGNTAAIDAVAIAVGRIVAPDLTPEQFLDKVIAVNEEMEACKALAAMLQDMRGDG